MPCQSEYLRLRERNVLLPPIRKYAVLSVLFEDREYTEYKGFVLRNSGNDSMWTRLLDGFESRMLDAYGATVIHQAWKGAIILTCSESNPSLIAI